MTSELIYDYQLTIKPDYIDSFGHVNNAMYLTMLEEARWDFLIKNNYDLDKIKITGLGPTIVEINIRFLKELFLNDVIHIKTQVLSYERKIGLMKQDIYRESILCSEAILKIGLFDLAARKLVQPTEEWLRVMSGHNA